MLTGLYGPHRRAPDPSFDSTQGTPAPVAYTPSTHVGAGLRLLSCWLQGNTAGFARLRSAMAGLDQADTLVHLFSSTPVVFDGAGALR